MSNQTRQCPVCRNEITPTREKNICGHLDKAHHPCPASYSVPFDLAINLQDPPTADQLRAVIAEIHEMSRRK